jgi:AAA+ ATPase superfamily predicted ATPase
MENPFRYGEIVSGSFFTDRADEITDLVSAARSGQNVVIISPRRYGKTSLVLNARERLTADGALVSYVDLLRTSTLAELANELATALYNGVVAPVERLKHQVGEMFASLPVRPKLTVNPNGTWGVELAVSEHRREAEDLLERLLELPQTVAHERQRRVVLVLDEFQQVIEIDEHLPALMRSVFQTQADVAHIFLGSRQHLMRKVFTDQNQPLYRSARALPLGVIPAATFATFIRERCRATHVAIDQDAVERVLTITGGHPHDTQELAHFAWALAYAGDGRITTRVVDAALDKVVAAEDAHYTTLWESLTLAQRRVVLAIAREPSMQVFGEAFRRTHRLGAASTVQTALERLVDREIADGASINGFTVPDAFLRAWLQHTVA